MAAQLDRPQSANSFLSSSLSSISENDSGLQLSTARGSQPLANAKVDTPPQAKTKTPTTYITVDPQQSHSVRRSDSSFQKSENTKRSEKTQGVTIQVLPPRPALPEARRQRIRPRPDMDYSSYRKDEGERELYRRPTGDSYASSARQGSYAGPGAQAVPYQPYNFNPYAPYAPHPEDRFRLPHNPRESSTFGPSPPLPPHIPIRPETERLTVIRDDLDRVMRELNALKDEHEGKNEATPMKGPLAYLATQRVSPSHDHRSSAGESSKQEELESLLVQLQAEKLRARKLEIEKEAIQTQAIREAENDLKLRAAAELAAEEDRRKREDEVRKEVERETLAKIETERKTHEELQLAQLEQLQQMMERLGNQVSIMEKKEADRLAGEQREEERQERERIEEMEREALQKMREERARQEQMEADRRAEEEKAKQEQEQEEKDRAAQDLKQAMLAQEEERIRAEEKVRREQELLLQKTLEDAKRQEASRQAADDEMRRLVGELVKQSLEEKQKSENERLHSDLRRHTKGTLADIHISNTQRHQRPRVLVGTRPPALLEPSTEFPSSNPFSRVRSRGPGRDHIRDSQSSREGYDFAGAGTNHLFGEAPQDTHWTFEDDREPRSRLDAYTDNNSTASSLPPSPVNMGHGNHNSVSDTNGMPWIPQNPFGERQRQKIIPAQVRRTQISSGTSFSQYQNPVQILLDQSANDDAQSSTSFPPRFSNSNGLHGDQAEHQYPSNGSMAGYDETDFPDIESPEQPIHTPNSSSALGNSYHLGDIDPGAENRVDGQGNHGDAKGNEGNESNVDASSGSNAMEQGSVPEEQRFRNQARPMQPPPSGPPAPTPPPSIPPKPAGWGDPRGHSVLNNHRSASVTGFPPSLNRSSSQGSQQLVSTVGMLNNVPYVMVPLIPGYPIQFSSPTQQIVTPQPLGGDKPATQAHPGNSAFINNP